MFAQGLKYVKCFDIRYLKYLKCPITLQCPKRHLILIYYYYYWACVH